MHSRTDASDPLLDSNDPSLYDVACHVPGPAGRLPLSAEMLRMCPSGDLFGMTQDVGMGWKPDSLTGPRYVLLSTLGGMRREDGTPVALGYHAGHWELGLAIAAAADEIRQFAGVPYAAYCTDPCDGRTQGTNGMFDSLAFRNDAASIFRRQVRSLPTAQGVLGIAACDKGLPAMMMALASIGHLPCVLVPGGVTLAPSDGEDLGKVQSIGARFARGELSLDDASVLGCRACASPGGGCQFLGTAATSQVVGEALGLTLPHAALAPSGQPIWLDMARRSTHALRSLDANGTKTADLLTDASIQNAMATFAAFGGSTNLILHLPAIAHAAGLRRPTIDDWTEINRRVPRLVDVLPNGPTNYPTVQVYLAGGVPEVMLRLRDLNLLDLDARTVSGHTLGFLLEWWEDSERRKTLRELLLQRDRVDPDDVIMTPKRANQAGLTSTACFPRGNLAPEGSVIKSTAIDPRVIGPDGIYLKTGPARVFVRESEAIAAIKGNSDRPLAPGDVLVLIGRGPMGSGMEEIYQITAALKHLSWGHEVAVITDARFSGVSTGACIGLVGPEALADGPLGKVRDGDRIKIRIDCKRLEGSVDLIGDAKHEFGPKQGTQILTQRAAHPDLSPDEHLPDETRLWAALQQVSGGTWGGCVFDIERIIACLESNEAAERKAQHDPSSSRTLNTKQY